MRYFYRGMLKDTGRTVEGHVEASGPEHAYNVLSSNGVITETLTPDPKPLQVGPDVPLPTSPQYADAIDSALDSASSQIDFDSLVDRYKGKRVWVIDRDKIRMRVAQVVDKALQESHFALDDTMQMRARVATAIHGLFADTRNIATEKTMAQVEAERARLAQQATQPMGLQAPLAPRDDSPALEKQIDRLTKLVDQAESVLAAMSLAARSGRGGGGGHRYTVDRTGFGEEQNAVLLEVFKSNLELARSMDAIGGSVANARPAAPPPPPIDETAPPEPASTQSEG